LSSDHRRLEIMIMDYVCIQIHHLCIILIFKPTSTCIRDKLERIIQTAFEGVWKNRSTPPLVLGKAITSLIEGLWQTIDIRRSRPMSYGQ
jgi:hypothetical protein